jgi:hypothetical protein
MTFYIDLNYTKFPPLLGIPLTLNPSVLLFRNYDINYQILSNKPAYFSTYSNAKEYLHIKNRNLGIFLLYRSRK